MGLFGRLISVRLDTGTWEYLEEADVLHGIMISLIVECISRSKLSILVNDSTSSEARVDTNYVRMTRYHQY